MMPASRLKVKFSLVCHDGVARRPLVLAYLVPGPEPTGAGGRVTRNEAL